MRDLFARRKEPREIYRGLRDRALQLTRQEAGLPDSGGPWGVVMDWGIGNGAATVVALADGTASIYFDSGGGFIGGHMHDPIRTAAQLAVKVAATVQSQLKPSGSDFSLPSENNVVLYVHTDSGLLIGSTSVAEITTNRHPLAPLANAMQNVITQYRLYDQKKRTS